jgi:hypothetical protein
MDNSNTLDASGGLQTQPGIQKDQQDQQSKHYRHVSQESGIEGASNSAASMSIRLSCDRCRLQKLKCTTPAGSNICERCTRAMVPCLFGRRTYSKCKKQSSNKSGSSTTSVPSRAPVVSQDLPAVGDPTVPGTSGAQKVTSESSSTSSSSHSAHPSPFPEWNLDPLIMGSTVLDDAFGTYDFGDPQSCTLEGTYGAWPSIGPDFDNGFDQTADCFGWLQDSLALEGEDSQPMSLGRAGTRPQQSTNPVALLAPADAASIYRASSQTSLQLTSLVSQIQSQLRELEEGSWQHWESRTNLDDYPVGNILELSQKFGAMAGDILSTNFGSAASFLDTSSNRQASRPPLPSEAAADTPSVLLVMAGYMWMMEIYTLALHHFKQYLHNMPGPHINQDLDTRMDCSSAGSTEKAQEPGAAASAALTKSKLPPPPPPSSGLALGLNKLLSANAVHYLYQINTAVRMVQDALRDVERHFGRGGVFARDLAMALLRSPSTRRDSSLEETATGIRELIRERCHF